MRRALLVLVALAAFGCDNGPYCGQPADVTGRLIPYCDDPRQEPVCDEPGMEAHYEDTAMGVRLVGGRRAICDIEDEIVCPMGTVGEAYCITDPEL